MFAKLMKKAKSVSTRVSDMAYALLKQEMAATGESQGAVIERCLFQCLRGPEAVKLIKEMAAKDPALRALLDAIGAAPARK